jgi:hypothetical protein
MFWAMDLPQYLQGFSFRFAQPEHGRSRPARAVAAALRGFGVPLDALNTRLPLSHSEMRRRLRGTRNGSAGLPLAVRAIINRGVAHLAEREAFVALGLAEGDSLLAAVAGNREKWCVGVHEVESEPPSLTFLTRFTALASDEHHFVEENFGECVTRLDDRSIGLCFVSAGSHEPVARQLVDCEHYLAENAYLLVDNANCEQTRQAAFDFVSARRNQYRVLMDVRTAKTCSLTWGRGLLVIQLLGRNAILRPHSEHGTSPVLVPAA